MLQPSVSLMNMLSKVEQNTDDAERAAAARSEIPALAREALQAACGRCEFATWGLTWIGAERAGWALVLGACARGSVAAVLGDGPKAQAAFCTHEAAERGAL